MSGTSSIGYSASATARASKREAHPESETGPEFTISQMSRLCGVSLRTLRFYEDRGLIRPRREGNARFYRAADRVRMEMILRGKKLGFTLTEINDLIGGKQANETPDLEEQLNRIRSSARSVTSNANAMRSIARSRGSAPPTTICCKASPLDSRQGE